MDINLKVNPEIIDKGELLEKLDITPDRNGKDLFPVEFTLKLNEIQSKFEKIPKLSDPNVYLMENEIPKKYHLDISEVNN